MPLRDRGEAPAKQNNRDQENDPRAQANAPRCVTASHQVQDTDRDSASRAASHVPNLTLDALSPRDRQMLEAIVACRLLAYRQIGRLFFNGRNASAARRRLRALQDAGWVRSWEFADRRGGHTRYASVTRRATRLLLEGLTRPPEARTLVSTMLPTRRAPLELGREAPKWLAHQREVNELVVASRMSGRVVLWASSWDCPFPSRAGILELPQPDYVLVEMVDGVARLVFAEHDRGTEPLERFSARKIRLYAGLSAFPEVTERLFGFRSFEVRVTVIDVVRQQPLRRLRALRELAQRSAAPAIFSFTLGGWLAAFADACTWFDAATGPVSDSVRHANHMDAASLPRAPASFGAS